MVWNMKRFIARLICCFVPSKALRRKIRNAAKRVKPQNNIIEIVKADGRRVRVKRVRGCKFKFAGCNNHVVLHEPFGNLKLIVDVSSNVYVELHSCEFWQRNIKVMTKYNQREHNRVIIGKNVTTTNVLLIDFCQSCGDVIIGDDCMFSWGVAIRTGDSHAIFDQGTGQLLNKNQSVYIGNHVWVGADALIQKGVRISDNSVVATRSIVTKQFDQGNVVIAGVPARIVRENIGWSRNTPFGYAMDNGLEY